MNIITASEPVAYEEAVSFMERCVAGIADGQVPETLWFLEHPPLYTAGTSARDEDLLDRRLPVHRAGRGGQYTYHGPGQRVVYTMLDLRRRQAQPDVRRYVWMLEEWIIKTLQCFDINGERREGRVGVWVQAPEGEAKIAAIGVRIRRWVTYHGISINVSPDLSHYAGIVPCGIGGFGVTSMEVLKREKFSPEKVDRILQGTFFDLFRTP